MVKNINEQTKWREKSYVIRMNFRRNFIILGCFHGTHFEKWGEPEACTCETSISRIPFTSDSSKGGNSPISIVRVIADGAVAVSLSWAWMDATSAAIVRQKLACFIYIPSELFPRLNFNRWPLTRNWFVRSLKLWFPMPQCCSECNQITAICSLAFVDNVPFWILHLHF